VLAAAGVAAALIGTVESGPGQVVLE